MSSTPHHQQQQEEAHQVPFAPPSAELDLEELDNTDHRKNLTLSPPHTSTPQEWKKSSGDKEPQDQQNENENPVGDPSAFLVCMGGWSKFTQRLNFYISSFVVALSLRAAKRPKATLGLVLFFSVAVMTTGLFTNFSLDVNEEEMFAPVNSRFREFNRYLNDVPGFPVGRRGLFFSIHRGGENVMGYETIDRLFQVIDTVRVLPDYDSICEQSSHVDAHTGARTCKIQGPSTFWHNNATIFREDTQFSDELTIAGLSNDTFPGGSPVFPEFMIGKLRKNEEGLITYAQAIFGVIELTNLGEKSEITMEFELDCIDALTELRDRWAEDPTSDYTLEFVTLRSVPDELMRAIFNDLPLIPCVFIIMTLFTMFIFWRKDKIQSRTLLGIGSVVTIVMSMLTGYGLCFIIGVPFTSMTQMLPFVVFGVGLDDTFIITGAYFRTDPSKDAVERIRDTMEEVGNSISLTTITTVCAFSLGCISSIPSIRWLCIYAAPTIFIDYIYQITFFIAVLVIDEHRIQANRRDICIWITVQQDEDDTKSLEKGRPRGKTEDDSSDGSTLQTAQDAQKSVYSASVDEDSTDRPKAPLPDRFMSWYADRLLLPKVKIFVVFAFTVFLAGCAYSATKFSQEFKPSEFMPDDSYAGDFLAATDTYADATVRFPAVFRFVDQSDPEVQEQMLSFVADMVALPEFGKEPELCWVRDFQRLKNGEFEAFEDYAWIFNDEKMTFNEQLKFALSIPEIELAFGQDIALDADGNIEVSKCWLTCTNLDLNVVQDQINALEGMQRVMRNHPMNRGLEEYAFFSHDSLYFIWEFYSVAVDELVFTTISGIVAVTALGFLLIPHWSATLFVTPLICILYTDLIGTLQFSGLHINPMTYVCLVISIGLLVDFLMHVILRYYESTAGNREEKVKDTLRTMGASILVGGLSTCLGVVPLAFSTSGILKTVFISFISMVSLGVGHGLILLPVLLSYFGPEVTVRLHHRDFVKNLEADDAECQTHHHSLNQSQTEALDDKEVAAARFCSGTYDSFERPKLETVDSDDEVSEEIDVDHFRASLANLPSVDVTEQDQVSAVSPLGDNSQAPLELNSQAPSPVRAFPALEPEDADILVSGQLSDDDSVEV